MSSSIVSALKAHETAKSLMVSMSVEELLATNEALSNLALECSILVAAQVELLLSYVQSDPRTVLRVLSLKCLIKLARKAAGMTGIEETAVEVFTSIYECAEESPYVKLLALQALRKVLSLMKLKASASNWSEVQPVLGFLVEVVCTMRKSRPDLLKIVNAQLNLGHGAPASVSFKNEESIYDSDFSTCAVLLVCSQVKQLDCERTIEGRAFKHCFLRMTKLVAWITSASLPPHVLLDSLVLVTEVRRYMTLEEAESVDTKISFVVASFIQDKEFWYAYKAVAVAACHCLWKHSASAIGEFMHRAQSQSTFYWLKAFTDVCTFEESLQRECSLKAMQCCVDELELKITMHCCISANLGQAIARALSSAYAAENSLAAAAKQKVMFGFQRQLLSLRVAFIRTPGELLGLIAPLCTQIKQ
ncbi:hypothetical protein L7F22_022791 [Adiantum nelumboides]|nr:hypothetical protein [Adiantum nelumboides]